MTTPRTLSVPAIGLLAAMALAGCSLLTPQQPTVPEVPESPEPTPSVSVEDLNDTTWSGTDSEDTETTFTFHEGGSTDVTFNANPYDDPADTWALDGTRLTITIYNVEGKNATYLGDAIYVGEVSEDADSIDLNVSFTDVTDTRTLTIVKG